MIASPNDRPLILIVDDSQETRSMYGCYFEAEGCRVEHAENGFQGLTKAFRLHPHAIVVDLLMPALDGWETIRLLRNRSCTHATPIIAITGDGDLSHLKLAKNAGCDSVLVKPCAPDVILTEVWRLLAARTAAPSPA